MPFGVKKAAAGLAALPPEQLYQQAKESFAQVQGDPEKWRSVMAPCKQLISEDLRVQHVEACRTRRQAVTHVHACVEVCAHTRSVRRKLPVMPADGHSRQLGLLSPAVARMQ